MRVRESAVELTYSVGLDCSALDPNFKAHAGRGIGRYVQELVRYFERHELIATDPHKTALVGRFDHSWFTLPRFAERVLTLLPRGRQTVRQQLCYPLQLRSQKMAPFGFLHFPAHMDAPSWSARPYIVTVLDLIPLVLADLYRPAVADFRFALARWLELRAIRGAAHVLAISECTARDCVKYLNIPRDRITVTPLGVDAKFFANSAPDEIAEVRVQYGLHPTRPVLLYVGGIDERKNVRGLLDLFVEVQRACGEQNFNQPQLVLAGKISGDRNYGPLVQELNARKLADDVVLAGFVEDRWLLPLYQTSAAFIFPSLYEGFGLPPLEALAAGVPVVSSNSSAMPEVLGTAAALYDPSDAKKGAQLVFDILQGGAPLKESLMAAGREQAHRFTWDETGRSTLGVYEGMQRR